MDSFENSDIPVMSKRISVRQKLKQSTNEDESQSSSLKLSLKKSSIVIRKAKVVLPPIIHDKSKTNNIDKMTNALLNNDNSNQVQTRLQQNLKLQKEQSINTMFNKLQVVQKKDQNLLSDSMDVESSNTINNHFLGSVG